MAKTRQKPVGTTVGHRKGSGRNNRQPTSLTPAKARPRTPTAPKHGDGTQMALAARRIWRAFWASPLSAVATDVDMERARAWILAVDERAIVWKEIRANRLTTGSKGQVRLNPLVKYWQSLNAQVGEGEEVLGINPRARFRLGLDLASALQAEDDIAAYLDDPDTATHDGESIPDDAMKQFADAG